MAIARRARKERIKQHETQFQKRSFKKCWIFILPEWAG